MYSQNDLDEAVAAGAMSADAATALRRFVEQQRALPGVDEEHFRLITGFNDIFVAIASAILLFAVGWIGASAGEALAHATSSPPPTINQPPEFLQVLLAGAAVSAVSWGLALFFTARRRMALPSILLLLAFAGGIFVASASAVGLAVGTQNLENNEQLVGIVVAVAAAIGAGGTWLHWRRFRVPITVAAGAAAVSAIAVGLLVAALGDPEPYQKTIWSFVLLLGVGVFLFAMRWDSSDPARVTRRSDVAFWLHLLAAPMIVHPVFTLLELNDGTATVGEGLGVIALYVAMGITALAIDRRALLVSALAYVLYALNELFREFGAVELNVALTALVIGSALLLLSAFWHQARSMVVRALPVGLQGKLPYLDRAAIPAPAA